MTYTTVEATKAPKGAIRVGILGPPPHYSPANLTAKAGVLVFYLTNTSLTFHDLAIGSVVSGPFLALSDTIDTGHSAVFTVKGLPPGTYAIWCTIDDHAAEGMVGTLTVK